MNDIILDVHNLSKTYRSGELSLTVLKGLTFVVEKGTTCAIIGPSGSGKTTLLGLCAGLDRATSGSVVLNGIRLDSLSEDERAGIRNHNVGFVFQNFQLIPTLTALENVMVPLELRGDGKSRPTAVEFLERVGLEDRLHHFPLQLSGGEQQRVALARAFVNRPRILFVDEPTGNLDTATSGRVEDLLFALNQEEGTTLLLVTHNLELARRTQRIIRLRAGTVEDDIFLGDQEE